MLKEEMNQVIKDAMVRNLRKETDIPENIGSIYRNWVIGKVRMASAQLQEQVTQAQQAKNGEEQQKQEAS